jgi:hypothetical protein
MKSLFCEILSDTKILSQKLRKFVQVGPPKNVVARWKIEAAGFSGHLYKTDLALYRIFQISEIYFYSKW